MGNWVDEAAKEFGEIWKSEDRWGAMTNDDPSPLGFW